MLPQTLKFSNGVKLTHSEASRSVEKYCKAVESGKIVIEGMTAKFQFVKIECECRFCKTKGKVTRAKDCKKFQFSINEEHNWRENAEIVISGVQKNPVSTRKILMGV